MVAVRVVDQNVGAGGAGENRGDDGVHFGGEEPASGGVVLAATRRHRAGTDPANTFHVDGYEDFQRSGLGTDRSGRHRRHGGSEAQAA